ncbi:MAG: hypothetical protein LRY43_00115 [Gammaproteobacteria bacterium]|nr:hypothetical protein [Gammaproteobacteria bacterium]
MSDRNDVSFNHGEEEEFHITDDDIDRELAAMEEENTVTGSDDDLSEVSAKSSEPKRRFSALKNLKRKHWIFIAIVILVLLMGLLKMVGNKSPGNDFEQIVPAATTANKSMVKKKSGRFNSSATATAAGVLLDVGEIRFADFSGSNSSPRFFCECAD